ncbi:MAG: hypothetical protein M3Z25_14995 [Actinomycetota bacterium]|nr:hypothetical protein [Actinomycetota bacterium]
MAHETVSGDVFTGIYRDGVVHPLRGPLDAACSALLSARAKQRVSWLAGDVMRHHAALRWSDEAAAADLDLGSAQDHAGRRLGNPELRDQLLAGLPLSRSQRPGRHLRGRLPGAGPTRRHRDLARLRTHPGRLPDSARRRLGVIVQRGGLRVLGGGSRGGAGRRSW